MSHIAQELGIWSTAIHIALGLWLYTERYLVGVRSHEMDRIDDKSILSLFTWDTISKTFTDVWYELNQSL